jgi:hypothetical protein
MTKKFESNGKTFSKFDEKFTSVYALLELKQFEKATPAIEEFGEFLENFTGYVFFFLVTWVLFFDLIFLIIVISSSFFFPSFFLFAELQKFVSENFSSRDWLFFFPRGLFLPTIYSRVAPKPSSLARRCTITAGAGNCLG